MTALPAFLTIAAAISGFWLLAAGLAALYGEEE
jgi:hypothetical protein